MVLNGDHEEEIGFISLYLWITNYHECFRHVHENFSVVFEFGLMDLSTRTIYYPFAANKANSYEFNAGLGFPKFFSHADLFSPFNKFAFNGKLTIACKVS